MFPLFSFPSLYPFAEEYGGDFPYQDFNTFHSRLGTSVVLCMCVKVCACDCKFRDYLRVTFCRFDTYCIILEHLSVHMHMDVHICPCIFEYARVCTRVLFSPASGPNNLLLSDNGIESWRCTYAESYLERPARSCQLLLCAGVSCLLGS